MITLIKDCTIFQTKTDSKTLIAKHKKYQGIINSIIFSIVETKPYIIFAILVASCFARNLGYKYIEVLKIILQYFKRSKN